MTTASSEHGYMNENNRSAEVICAGLASDKQLNLFSGPHVNLKKSRNGLSDHKIPRTLNLIYTTVETFNGSHATLTNAIVLINKFLTATNIRV